jgi:hypothetical protein
MVGRPLQMEFANLDAADAESIEIYRQCPVCGERSFSQRRMWFLS